MSIDYLTQRGGFKSKAEFARYAGLHPDTISRWDDLPKWAYRILELREELATLKETLRKLSDG
jgi:hypothetical protein